MKKRLLTVSFLLIAVFLLMASALAAGSINDLQTTVGNVTASLNGTDKIDVTCTDLTAGDEYLIMVLEGSQTPDSSNIVYIDQKTANSSSLTFTVNPMRLEDGDYYIALSSTDSDLAIVGSFNVGTVELRPPTFTIEPDQGPYLPGDTITVTLEVEGDIVAYQWYIRNAGQATFSKSSVTTNTYTYKLSASSSGRQAYCEITDKNGFRVATEVITLPVITDYPDTEFKITKQPQSVSVPSGQTASATVEATGEGLRYQWYIKNANQTAFNKSSVTTSTYSVKMSANSDGRQIYCVVTDQNGSQLKSDTVTLSMLSGPVITKQPQSVSAPSGQNVSVTVEANGENLTYQWYIKNANQSSFNKSSVTTRTYSVKMSANSNGRQIYCIVTDKNGQKATSDIATLSLSASSIITKHPQDTEAFIGEIASVTVEAKGEGLTYQWYLKNASQTAFSRSSVTTSTYSVKMSANSVGRQVYCVVTDQSGYKETSNIATLSLPTGPVINKQPEDVAAFIGDNVTVSIEASGEGLTYQWYLKNAGQTAFSRSSVTTNTYSVKMSNNSVGRQIYCVVTDKEGKKATSNTVTLSLSKVPVITKQPVDITTALGNTAEATVEAKGDGLTYQWYIKNVGQSAFSKSSITTNKYSVKMSANNDGRQIYCLVKDQDGDTVKSDVVTLRIG